MSRGHGDDMQKSLQTFFPDAAVPETAYVALLRWTMRLAMRSWA